MIDPVVDIAALACFVVFFAIAVALVKGCELIIGPDADSTADEPSEQAAA